MSYMYKGFDLPHENWSKLPNDLLEASVVGKATFSCVMCVFYVLRHTWGYQEFNEAKRISVNEFMKGRKRKDGSRIDSGTGLSKPSVTSGTREGVAKGWLIEEVDTSDRARTEKRYALRMGNTAHIEEGGKNSSLPLPKGGGGKYFGLVHRKKPYG